MLMTFEEIVLIQTAKGNILIPTNGMQENVRMLFDRTYITEKKARKLILKFGKKE